MAWLGFAASLAIGYLLGSVLFGDICSRAFGGVDIRSVGSRNPGFTNVLRHAGARAGLLTLLGDVAKGALAVAVGRWGLAQAFPTEGGLQLGATAALGALAGHFWPVYHRFRGGKGVATAVGAFLCLTPPATAFAAGVWAITLLLGRYMSLASMLGALALPVYLTWMAGPVVSGPYLLATAWVAAGGIVLRHRANLARLLRKTEPKFHLKRS